MLQINLGNSYFMAISGRAFTNQFRDQCTVIEKCFLSYVKFLWASMVVFENPFLAKTHKT